MPLVRFEPTIPMFERAKTAHTLDGAATVIGNVSSTVEPRMISRVGQEASDTNSDLLAVLLPSLDLVSFAK
jgi:hypothetical protein